MGKTLDELVEISRRAAVDRWNQLHPDAEEPLDFDECETDEEDDECDRAAASAVRKAVLTEAIEAAKQKVEALNNRVLSTDDDGLAGYYDDMADGAREVVAALHRLIEETSIGVMPPAEQAEQSVSAQAPLQSDNHREAEG